MCAISLKKTAIVVVVIFCLMVIFSLMRFSLIYSESGEGFTDEGINGILGFGATRVPFLGRTGPITSMTRRLSDGSLFVGYENGCAQQIRICDIGNYMALTDMGPAGTPTPPVEGYPSGAELEDMINQYSAAGINATQQWLMFRWNQYDSVCTSAKPHLSIVPYPLVLVNPTPPILFKYDLEDYNETYWADRVERLVDRAAENHMVTIVSFYVPHDETSTYGGREGWYTSPYNTLNNKNGYFNEYLDPSEPAYQNLYEADHLTAHPNSMQNAIYLCHWYSSLVDNYGATIVKIANEPNILEDDDTLDDWQQMVARVFRGDLWGGSKMDKNLIMSNLTTDTDYANTNYDIYEFHNFGPGWSGCDQTWAYGGQDAVDAGWDSSGNRKSFLFSSDGCGPDRHCGTSYCPSPTPNCTIEWVLENILDEGSRYARGLSPKVGLHSSFVHIDYMDKWCDSCNKHSTSYQGISCVENDDDATDCQIDLGHFCRALNNFKLKCALKTKSDAGEGEVYRGGFAELIDDDSYKDLVLWANDLQVDIFINDGEGALEYSTSIVASGNGIRHVEPIDIDGDTDIDLAVATDTGTYLFENDGYGDLSGSPTTLLSSKTDRIAKINLNPLVDSYPDLALATETGIKLYVNNGSGSFTYSGTIAIDDTSCVVKGDFDGDTYDDMVVAVPNDSTQVYLNNGYGSFTAGEELDTNATTDLAIADFDGDTYLDVYVATMGSDDIIFHNTEGTGEFTAYTLPEFQDSLSVNILDYDNDGNMDFFVAGTDQAVVVRYEFDNEDIEAYQAADTFNPDQTTYRIIPCDFDDDDDGELIILGETGTAYAENLLIGEAHIDCGGEE